MTRANTRTEKEQEIRHHNGRPATLVLLFVAACGGADQPEPGVVVGPVVFEERIVSELGPAERDRLAQLAAFGLAVAEGRTDELGRPFIERRLQALVLQRLSAEMAVREAGYDEEGLRTAYDADPEPELLVRHLVVLSERWRPEPHRAEARSRAEAARSRVLAGEPFEAVAAEVSEEPGADRRGGLLQPGRQGSWVPEFWVAAVALERGEMSEVVETRYGFHVIKLEEGRAVPYEEARDAFVARVARDSAAVRGAEAWASRESARVQLDTGHVHLWRSGVKVDTLTLAHWPGGGYTGADFRSYTATLEPDARARLAGADPHAYASVVAAAARNAYLAGLGPRHGVEPSPEDSAAAARNWRLRAEAWASALGFEADQPPGEVGSAALRALVSERQSAAIARSELAPLAPWLRALYPVELNARTDAALDR